MVRTVVKPALEMSENAVSISASIICASQYAFVPATVNVSPFNVNFWPETLTNPVVVGVEVAEVEVSVVEVLVCTDVVVDVAVDVEVVVAEPGMHSRIIMNIMFLNKILLDAYGSNSRCSIDKSFQPHNSFLQSIRYPIIITFESN